MFRSEVMDRLAKEFGAPARDNSKITAWDIGEHVGLVLQTDSPKSGEAALVWLPYPPDGENLPEMALEYPADAGRHSNTYPSPGLERGKPALKLVIKSTKELDDLVAYISAFKNPPQPPLA